MPFMEDVTPLLWLDLETTGLDPGRDVPVEVAFAVTDPDHRVLGRFHSLVDPGPDGYARLDGKSDVLALHEGSGLWGDLSAAAFADVLPGRVQVEDAVMAWLAGLGIGEPGSATFAGSGIARFDLPLLAKVMPRIPAVGTYFVHDVGVLRRAYRRATGVKFTDQEAPHRAAADVDMFIAESVAFADLFRAAAGTRAG